MSVETIRLGSSTYLATEDDVVESFRLDGQPLEQVGQGLRSATVTVHNRLNRQRSFSISVKRVPATTPALCRLGILSHELALGAAEVAGDKDITWNYRGTGFVLRGVVVQHSAEQRGVTSIHTYTGTFGVLETSSL